MHTPDQGENASKSLFYLDSNKQIQPAASIPVGAALRLISTYGQVLHQWINATHPIKLPEDLPAGVYVFIVVTESKTYSQLLIISRP